MNPLRILVADDHEIVRRGLIALLKSKADCEVCGQAEDGRKAVEKAKELMPDIVILDIGMPNLNGLEAARQIQHHNPRAKVLILTITEVDEVVRAVLEAGAQGFVLKSDAARDLVAAVEALQSGKTFFSSRITDLLVRGYASRGEHAVANAETALPSLTPREREIVQLLAEGKSGKEAATHLSVSVKTIDTHRTNIMRKLNLHSVTELVLYAIKNHMVQVVAPPRNPPESTKAS